MPTIKDSVNLSPDETTLREYHAIDRGYVPILSRGVEGRIAVLLLCINPILILL